MKTKVLGFIGLGVAAITLMAFVYAKGNDDGKKKKYHVIHQEDGVLQEFDTILPMSSSYSVEDYLKDIGVNSEDVEIIKMPSISDDHFIFHGSDGEKIIMNHFSDDLNWHQDGEIIKIISEEGEDGKITIKKYVDGEEIEMTEEDLEKFEDHKHGHQIIIEDNDGSSKEKVTIQENGNKVKIIVEEDKGGDKKVKKYVDGKEVEVNEEDIERVELEIDGEEINIEIEAKEIAEELEEAMKELEIEMENLDINLESILKHIDIEVEEGDEKTQKVIIKMESDMKELQKDLEEMMKDFDHDHFMEMHKDIRVHGDEDFTIVIVEEDIDANAIEKSIRKEIVTSNQEFKMYPNPSEGAFTIEFEQSEKLPTTVEVVDSEGKSVFKEKLGKFSGKYKKEVNIEKHGSGTYVVKIQRGDDVTVNKVVIE